MSTLSKLFILFTLALSVSSLATPHAARSLHQHHGLAARKAVPEPAPGVGPYADVTVVKPKKLRRRSDSSRCIARSSSAVSSSTPVPTSSTQAPAVGVAAGPSSSSSSSTPAPTPTPTPSSSKAEPAPSSSTPAPKPSSSKTSKTEAAPSSTAASGGSSESYLNGQQSGDGTFYAVGLGACGVTNVPSDKIAAVSHLLFDTFPGYDGVNPNNNPVCGKSITATYGGKSVTVTVEDRCTGCAITDLDFSTSAFDELGAESIGRLHGMTWVWNL
ncbi:hypothetical protein M0805_000355 [Coniferiporia weirii]|nr:hypothetical protein M0805_000355 [Coniferiporia weirii]